MPALSTAPSPPIKLLLIGDSSAGKTGALASLASAGFNLRILDLDNGIDILKSLLTDPKSIYDKSAINRVMFQTITETMRVAGGKIIPAKATVWPNMLKMLERWMEPAVGEEGTPRYEPAIDLGKITTWTQNDVLVIDSLTKASEAAMNFIQGMAGHLGTSEASFTTMREIGAAQALIGGLLNLLADTSIRCHVVVLSHITYIDDRDAQIIEGESRPRVGYPSAVGKALSPMIPRWFNSMLLAKTEGSGAGTRQMLYTKPMGVVGAKSSAPSSTPTSYPVATGLADYFKAVRQGKIPLAGLGSGV